MDYFAPPNSSEIHVLIVGSGFAGLTAAIECHRNGHTVTLLESQPSQRENMGDIISFGQNAARIFRSWGPTVTDRLEYLSIHADAIVLNTWRGELILEQSWAQEYAEWGRRYDGHRGETRQLVWDFLGSLGVEVKLGHKAVEYFEDDEKAGVVCENGARFEADVVLAADGVRSTGRKLVLGYEDKPKSSGYAVYRAWFPSDVIAKDPETSFFVGGGDKHIAWLGPDVHFIAASLKKGSFSWVCTHKDDADIEESWSLEAPVADALKVVDGWDPIVRKVIALTPEPLVDWKLVYRDPLPNWISPKKRITLIGDAAHPFLPTSIQGASQAMEDGVTLGICLRRAGKDNVPEAVAAFEALRYNRVLGAQKTGEQTRDIWHNADWDKVKEDPASMKLRREDWILNHDSHKFAEEKYDATVEALRKAGTEDTLEARKLHFVEWIHGFTEFN